MSSFISVHLFPPYILRQALSLNLELTGQWTLGILLPLHSQHWSYRCLLLLNLSFYMLARVGTQADNLGHAYLELEGGVLDARVLVKECVKFSPAVIKAPFKSSAPILLPTSDAQG